MLLRAHLALLLVNVIYGANYIIAKEVMPEHLSPSVFVMTRVLGALIMFWILNRFVGLDKVKTKDFVRLALCGLCGVALNQLFFFEGLSLTSPVNSAIIMTSTPVIVILLSLLVLRERITINRITGIVIGLAGAVGIILLGVGANTPGVNWLGDTFILINATSYAFYLVLVKPLMKKYSPITVISYVFLFGSAFVFPYASSDFFVQEWEFPTNVWLQITYVVVATTFIAYLLNIFALKIVSPTVSSSYIYLQPLLSLVFALLHDHWYKGNLAGDPGPWHVLCALMIFTGVYLVSRRKA